MKNRILVFFLLLLTLPVIAAASEELSSAAPAVFEDDGGRFLTAGETPVIGDMSYRSDKLSIEISLVRENRSDSAAMFQMKTQHLPAL